MKTISKLYEQEKCQNKGKFEFLNGEGNNNLKTAIVINELIKTHKLNFNENDIKAMLNEQFSELDFINKSNMNIFFKTFTAKMIRLKNYLIDNGYTFLRKPNVKTVVLNGEKFKTKYDIILKNADGEIIVARIKNSKPNITYRGQKEDTAVNSSIELCALEKIGKDLYPNNIVKGAIFFLTNKDDGKNANLIEFEDKKGKNMVCHTFSDLDLQRVFNRLNNILNPKTDSCGNCTDCRFNSLCNFQLVKDVVKDNIVTTNQLPSKPIFTSDQKVFTLTDNGVLRVLAIAGSGKTTAIVNRVISLIKKGFNPEKILLTTFTNQGVVELTEKLHLWGKVYNVNVDSVKIFNFNNLCLDLIYKNFKSLGFKSKPVTLSNVDKYKILSKLMDDNEIIEEYDYLYPTLDYFNYKGGLLRLESDLSLISELDYLDAEDVSSLTKLSLESSKILIKIYNEYLKIKKENSYIEINEQLELGLELLSSKEMVENLGFEHIIVDEAQDTNNIQLNIIYKLYSNSHARSLVFCGDDSQSIFSWRGATNRILLALDNYFDDVMDIVLAQNFRSTQEICDLTNRVIANNKNGIIKTAISDRHGMKPSLKTVSNLDEIGDEILALINKGVNPNDIAFISRKNTTLTQFADILKQKQINTNLCTNEHLIDNLYFKNIYDFSKFLIDNSLLLEFANFLNLIKHNKFINNKNIKKFIMDEFDDMSTIVSNMNNTEKLNYLKELLLPLSEEVSSIKFILSLINDEKIDDIKKLNSYFKELVEFKSDIVIPNGCNNDGVNLITAHSSKGKEYKYVFVLVDGYKDSFRYSSSEKEEERRVLFVAMTRAKEMLYVRNIKYNAWASEIASALS